MARNGRRRPPPPCPVDALLRLLAGAWTTSILWHLHTAGPLRFGELGRRLSGISAKVLTQRLRMLEGEGLVFRRHVPVIPPEVTYGLTARGSELATVFDGFEAVARRWAQEERREAEARPRTAVGSG
jgi:DNA-binding HxlR family transcriptional regulator